MNKSYLALLAVILACCIESPSETVFIKLAPPAMITSLESGTIDAAVTWEPWASRAVQGGLAYYAMNSSDIWEGHPCCVLASANDWAQNNADALTGFVAAHIAAINWINRALESDDSKIYEYTEQLTGLNRSVVEPALKNMRFDHEIDAAKMRELAEELMSFKLFDSQKWNASYYASIDAYVNSLIKRDYINNATLPQAGGAQWWQTVCAPTICLPLPQQRKTSVRVGYIKGDLHHLPLFVAMGEGFFDQAGLSVILEGFENGPGIMLEGFKMDAIDTAYLGIAPALLYGINANNGDDLRIDIVSSVNYEGSALIVRKGVKEKDIKTIATPGPGSVQYFLALKVVQDERLE